MEAWLLGKHTCLLNPSGRDFPREIINIGSPIVQTSDELNETINCFFELGYIPGFRELSNERKLVIEQTIQWSDGLNHVRAGNEILDLLEQKINYENIPESSYLVRARLRQKIKWILNRVFSYTHVAQNSYIVKWNSAELDRFSKKRMMDQKSFYAQNKLSNAELRKVRSL
jgi:hypothetical protein